MICGRYGRPDGTSSHPAYLSSCNPGAAQRTANEGQYPDDVSLAVYPWSSKSAPVTTHSKLYMTEVGGKLLHLLVPWILHTSVRTLPVYEP